ncbi:ATP phosphoribosyltransferase regulatory subunit [Persephonella sp.]
MNIDIPAGVRVFNRKETSQIKSIQSKISDIFERWGYEEIILPSFEFFEVHKKGLGEEIENRAFKLIDRSNGEILTLRADFTSQIARYFATLKEKKFPKRYYYTGNIFRYVHPKADRLWERRQTGIELIGVPELEADAEVITVAAQALQNLNISDFQIDINNVEIFNEIKNILNLDDEEFKKFMNYIKNREIYYLQEFVNSRKIDENLRDFIINIPKLQGDISLIKELKEKVKIYPSLVEILKKLERIYSILFEYGIKDRIVFDLGEPKEFSYYTGLVFEIFIKDFSKPVGYGGRYDSLISKYNGEIPATGFAFDLFNIWEYMCEKGLFERKAEKDFYIIDLTSNKKLAYKIGKVLREKGYKVGRDIIKRDLKNSLKFAFDEGYRKVIVVGLDSVEKDVYIYTSEDSFEKLNINEFLEKI